MWRQTFVDSETRAGTFRRAVFTASFGLRKNVRLHEDAASVTSLIGVCIEVNADSAENRAESQGVGELLASWLAAAVMLQLTKGILGTACEL